MKHRGKGDADDQAVLGEKPDHRLSPRLGTGRVQQLVTRSLELVARRCDSVGVRDLEFDRRLRNYSAGRPLLGAEAGLRRGSDHRDARDEEHVHMLQRTDRSRTAAGGRRNLAAPATRWPC